jgi:hypothetical protein
MDEGGNNSNRNQIKFYNSEIFHFNNKVAIMEFIEEKIKNNHSNNQIEQVSL